MATPVAKDPTAQIPELRAPVGAQSDELDARVNGAATTTIEAPEETAPDVNKTPSYKVLNEWTDIEEKHTAVHDCVKDAATGKLFQKRSPSELRFEHAKLFIPTILVKAIDTVSTVIFQTLKFVTFSAFFTNPDKFIEDKTTEWLKDLVGIPKAIVYLVATVFTPLFGIILPNDGRKLFHHLEENKPNTGIGLLNDLKLSPESFVPVEVQKD
ncbi:MAG: hypothetical protein S4CHLAM37_16420 [Chlamydiia bacterium]|nr:hypothetical protein [Chlamydiia bacterium]